MHSSPFRERGGEEVAPFRDRWAAWLDPTETARDVLRHFPKGSLEVTRIYPPIEAQER